MFSKKAILWSIRDQTVHYIHSRKLLNNKKSYLKTSYFVRNVSATFVTFRKYDFGAKKKIEKILSKIFKKKKLRAAECKNWKDISLRHCNAYHTKDGPWKMVREKAKQIRNKQDSLLELKRKLREERLTREKV